MRIHFLYGTETGSAEMLCEDIRDALGTGFECAITGMGEVEPADLTADTFYVFVTSSYGTGDLPSMAQPFYDKLEAEKPDLSAIRFAIFGLGDMVFAETFNGGSERLMEMLLACKAKMVGERGIHDASTSDLPEDIALPWTERVIALLQADAA